MQRRSRTGRRPRIGLVFDLRSEYIAAGCSEEEAAEFDSEETISVLARTIRSLGCAVERVGNARALCKALAAGKRWDLVFNVAEGLRGRSREAQVPAILEVYGIPYTFSDPLVSAVALDKAVAKRLIRDAGLRTAPFAVVERAGDARRLRMRFPLFVKPVAEGTGKGIDGTSLVRNRKDAVRACGVLLSRYRQPVLVEEFLPGREFTVGILGSGERARVLGTIEIVVLPAGDRTIYGYEMKEKCETLVRYTLLARGALRRRVEKLALLSYRVLECRDAGRVDIRMDPRGRPCFMEVNPLPGLHPTHSDLPMIAAAEGVSYRALIGAIVSSARRR